MVPIPISWHPSISYRQFTFVDLFQWSRQTFWFRHYSIGISRRRSWLVSTIIHRIMKLKLFLKTEFIFYKKHVKSCFCLFGLTQSVKFLKFKKVLPLDFWWVFFCKIFSFLLKLTATWSKPWVKCSKPILNLSLAKPWNLQCNCLGIVREWNRNCSTMWTSLWMVLFKTKPMYGK